MSDILNHAIGWTLLHSLWQATLISLLTGLLLVVLSKKTAHLRYIVAVTGLSLVLLTSLTTFAYYYKDATQTVTIDGATISNIFAPKTMLSDSIKATINSVEITPKDDVSPTSGLWSVANFKDYFERNLPLIVVLWLGGVAVLLLRLLGSLGYIYYLRRRMNFPPDEYWQDMLARLVERAGLYRTVELVESALVRTPMVVGYLKPLILFPIGMINRLSEQEVEAILAHEIAHIIRNDYIINLLQSIVESLFYYHPAVWLLSAAIRDERESACDEIAIDLIGGKKLNYAKALVIVQDMAFYPLSPSLAMAQNFAGSGKNQFLQRIQRILHQPQNKSFIMEKLIATLLVLFTLIGLTMAQSDKPKFQYENFSRNSLNINGEGAFSKKGYWNAKVENDEICFTLNNGNRQGNWITTECIAKSEFSALPTNGAEGTFSLQREAGTLSFTGKFEGDEGYGKQIFTPNDAFKSTLSQNGFSETNDEILFFAFLAKANNTYFSDLKNLNLTGLDEEQLKQFLIFRINPIEAKENVNFLKSKGYESVSAQDLINFKIHNVDKPFIESMTKTFGNDLTAEQILTAKIHGFDEKSIAEAKEINDKNVGFEDVLNFKIHGIDKEYINSMRNVGLKDLTNEELISIKALGITPDLVREYQKVGLKNITFDQIINLKTFDIQPDFILNLRKKGNQSDDAQDFINMKLDNFTNQALGDQDNWSSSGRTGYSDADGKDTWLIKGYKIVEDNGKIKVKYNDKWLSDSEVTSRSKEFQKLKAQCEKLVAEGKIQAEEGRKQAELGRLQAEEGRKQAAEGKIQAEEGRKQAELGRLQAEEGRKQAEKGRIQAEEGRKQAELGRLQALKNSNSHGIGHGEGHGAGHNSNDPESKALSWFIKQLLTEKHYEVGKKTSFSIDNQVLKVDGKKLPNEIHQRYKSNIERITKKKMPSKMVYSFKGVVSKVNGDSFEMEGEMTIDDGE